MTGVCGAGIAMTNVRTLRCREVGNFDRNSVSRKGALSISVGLPQDPVPKVVS